MTRVVIQQIAAALLIRGENLSVAESATGGLILSTLTDEPGASAWLSGGVVAYNNWSKTNLLGVQDRTLSTYGAVSEETARDMAVGVQTLFKTTWAVSETGIAGPQGGRRSTKPTGLTFIAVSSEHMGPDEVYSKRFLVELPGDRAQVKSMFAEAALDLLLQAIQSTT